MIYADLLQRFRSFDFKVDGIAMLRGERLETLAVGDRTIDLDCGNIGYIRTSGRITYSNPIQITCNYSIQNATEEMYLVLMLSPNENLVDYVSKAFNILSSTSGVTVTSQLAIKETIQLQESIPNKDVQLYRFTFNYSYRAIPNCIEPIPC